MCKKRGVRINREKTSMVYSGVLSVTGLRVEHTQPRCTRKERRNIRAAVKHCEIEYQNGNKQSDEYHTLWNSTSGKVAKLDRVGHPQAKKLRNRLQQIYPVLSPQHIDKLRNAIKKLESVSAKKRMKIGYIKQINKLIYTASLLYRTDKKLAHALTNKLRAMKPVKTYDNFWEV